MIREAKLSDLQALCGLYDQLRGGLGAFKGSPSAIDAKVRKAMQGMLKSKVAHVLVYIENGKVAGTCTAYILPRVYRGGKPMGILDTIVVDSHARGQGIGKQIIEAAIKLCRKAGCGQVNLTSNTQRTRAHRFYESLGFEATYIGFRRALDA